MNPSSPWLSPSRSRFGVARSPRQASGYIKFRPDECPDCYLAPVDGLCPDCFRVISYWPILGLALGAALFLAALYGLWLATAANGCAT